MTKKTGCLIFFVFILITGTEYLNSMEEERKKDSKIMDTLLKNFEKKTDKIKIDKIQIVNILLKTSEHLSAGTAKKIVQEKFSIGKDEAQGKADEEVIRLKAVRTIYFDSPCGAGSRTHPFLNENDPLPPTEPHPNFID